MKKIILLLTLISYIFASNLIHNINTHYFYSKSLKNGRQFHQFYIRLNNGWFKKNDIGIGVGYNKNRYINNQISQGWFDIELPLYKKQNFIYFGLSKFSYKGKELKISSLGYKQYFNNRVNFYNNYNSYLTDGIFPKIYYTTAYKKDTFFNNSKKGILQVNLELNKRFKINFLPFNNYTVLNNKLSYIQVSNLNLDKKIYLTDKIQLSLYTYNNIFSVFSNIGQYRFYIDNNFQIKGFENKIKFTLGIEDDLFFLKNYSIGINYEFNQLENRNEKRIGIILGYGFDIDY